MTLTTPIAFDMITLEPALRPATLSERDWLTSGYVRLRLSGPALRGFTAPGADDHVRIFFGPDGAPAPAILEQWREFPSREYTPVAADPEAGWVDFDVVIHGEGPGSTWAAEAPIGAPAAIAGPRRTHAVTGEPDAWFLAGDETAVPAINRFLKLRRPESPARVILEVAEENALVPIHIEHGAHLTVLVRGEDDLTETLSRLGESDRPQGSVLGFVAGEAGVVPAARALLLDRWGLPEEAVIVKGYWRR